MFIYYPRHLALTVQCPYSSMLWRLSDSRGSDSPRSTTCQDESMLSAGNAVASASCFPSCLDSCLEEGAASLKGQSRDRPTDEPSAAVGRSGVQQGAAEEVGPDSASQVLASLLQQRHSALQLLLLRSASAALLHRPVPLRPQTSLVFLGHVPLLSRHLSQRPGLVLRFLRGPQLLPQPVSLLEEPGQCLHREVMTTCECFQCLMSLR